MQISELLDQAKKATGVASDYKLAQVLDIPRERLSDYRKGKRVPDDYACMRLAMALHKDPLEVLAQVRAISEKSDERRAFWRSFPTSWKRGILGLLLPLILLTQFSAPGAGGLSGPFSRRRYFA